MDSSGSVQEKLVGSFEDCNKPSGSIKGVQLLGYLSV
jgi:hypothetical protein